MRICVLPGDGIGPEVTAAALRVLDGGRRRASVSPSSSTSARSAAPRSTRGPSVPGRHARGLPRARTPCCSGAVGGPRWNGAAIRPEQGLLALRSVLGCYANLRPGRRYTRHTTSPLREELVAELDLVIVRELIGGIYFGDRGLGDEAAYDTCNYSAVEIRRIVERACMLAERRSGRVTSVDKANVLATSKLWRRVAGEVAEQSPRRDARAPARRLDGDAARRAARRLRRDRHREPVR